MLSSRRREWERETAASVAQRLQPIAGSETLAHMFEYPANED